MRVYGFVENRKFLEQFVSMGVPAQFSQPCIAPSGYVWPFPLTILYLLVTVHLPEISHHSTADFHTERSNCKGIEVEEGMVA